MESKTGINFTKGRIVWPIILFAIPLVLAELLQNLYNSVDSITVGNFVGESALAAISVCATLSQLVVSFFVGLSVGGSVVTARAFGSGDQVLLCRTMRGVFTFSIILGLVLSAAGILLSPFLLRIALVPDDVFPEALIYLRIYLAGMFFMILYNVSSGILRAIGDSRNPFYSLSTACCVNIVLDIVFVAKFGWGIAGVGVATVIAQALSVLWLWHVMRRVGRSLGGTFGINFTELAGDRQFILELLRIGTPAGLQGSLISFSNLFVWRYVSSFGASAMAGVGVAHRLDRFIGMPCNAFGHAMTTFVSQNLGAKNYERARKGVRSCILLSLGYIALIATVLYYFADTCVLFFNRSPDVVKIGTAMMHLIIPFYLALAIRDVLQGTLRGYGNSFIPMVLSLVGMIVIRQIYLAVVMSFDRSIVHIYICYPIAWVATFAMEFIYYVWFMRKVNLPPPAFPSGT